jgi:dedicated sortase system histidine kinase
MLFDIVDTSPRYQHPAKPNSGDALWLIGPEKRYRISAEAPGKVSARYLQDNRWLNEPAIEAVWRDQAEGYRLELRMPLALTGGQLSFYLHDDGPTQQQYGPWLDASRTTPAWLIYPTNTVNDTLSTFAQAGLRLHLLDPTGWLIGTSGTPSQPQSERSHWLLQRLYRLLLSSEQNQRPYFAPQNFADRPEVGASLKGQASAHWYRDSQNPALTLLAQATPIYQQQQLLGILVAEQSSEQSAALTDQAMSRLFQLSVQIMLLAITALVAYASWLSFRIRKLSRAAEQALADQRALSAFPDSRASDEIGQLTRHYRELMQRVSEYTDYLQNLSRKLSHELRTPLAIVLSSLDNLANQPLDTKGYTYTERARDGALRLGAILTAMSEARRVEESIDQAELESVPITQLLSDISQAYRDIYPQHRIVLTGVDQQADDTIRAVPELLVQMLDKLVDNAASFCPAGGEIQLRYLAQDPANPSQLRLEVSNDGPLLPATMQHQLFDNMVSLREQSDDTPHLGLGLHIVRLIVDFHGGEVTASNRRDSSGVVFRIRLPRCANGNSE